MSKFSDRIPQLLKRSGREAGKLDSVLVIRLIIAAVIFAIAVIFKMPTAARIVLLALALIAAGYDLLLDTINSVEGGDFFAASLIILAAAVVSFFIGFAEEGTVLVIVYQLGLIVIAYLDERSKKTAFELLQEQDDDVSERVTERLRDKSASELKLAGTVKKSADTVLKAAMVLAVLYAVLLLFLGDFSVRVAIHRALMILVLCTPLSVVAAMPLSGIVGMCFSAQNGVEFNNAAVMEQTAEAHTAVFDKAGIFSQDKPRVLAVQSDIIDNRTFMNFAAHAVYYSEQPFAQAISSAYSSEYKLDVVSDFKELPGNGVELQIAGNPVILATASVFANRDIRVPQDVSSDGQTFFMTVAGRYVGRIVISDAVNSEAQDLVENIMASGVRRCVLLTEEGNEESQRVGDLLGFHEIYSECDTEKKLQLISDLSGNSHAKTLYIYANGFESHSDADVDIRVSKRSKFADALVLPDQIANLPFGVQICKRMCQVAKENAIFAFVIKAILIFLSMTGYCNLWFAIFVDMAAAVATQLHSFRITRDSLINSIKSRH